MGKHFREVLKQRYFGSHACDWQPVSAGSMLGVWFCFCELIHSYGLFQLTDSRAEQIIKIKLESQTQGCCWSFSLGHESAVKNCYVQVKYY